MSVAYLFPGQGAQAVGMGRDVFDAVPASRAIFEQANAALDFSLSGVCFDGPEDALTQTVNTQPAILTTSVALLEACRGALETRGDAAAFVAGHSLGEYSALVAAGSMTFNDAVCLVQERGRLMQEAGDQRQGAMAAVMGMAEETLATICSETGVDMANLNAPDQIVISGSEKGVARARELARERGARRVVALRVSAAFHSSLMDPAVPGMQTALEGARICSPSLPVIANVSAEPLNDAVGIVNELAEQIRSPVQWFRTIQYLKDHGVTQYIEIGPGKVLTGLVKRVHANAETVNVGTLEEVQAL